MSKAMVADIERAAFHDGYGIRTTVFFKGCPLRCEWCHNPECISPNPEILVYPERCIGCGKCKDGCYAGARVPCGKETTAEELLVEILQDKPYYSDRGGVTFSGGEPMLQADFLCEILPMCKENGIGRAIETSLVIYREDVFRHLNFIMADFKIWDDDIHRRYTGVGNAQIKENFRRLNELNIPIIARTPVITEIEQDIPHISDFLNSLKNVVKYELLPYHPLGNTKRKALGLPDDKFSVPDPKYIKELNQYAFIR